MPEPPIRLGCMCGTPPSAPCLFHAGTRKKRAENMTQHVDIYRLDWHRMEREFIKRVPLDDPMLVTPAGQPTQVATGWATYYEASEPHTMENCPHRLVPAGLAELEQAMAERDRYREALEQIEKHGMGYAIGIAKAALEDPEAMAR